MKPALRTTIKMLTQALITEPPIEYEEYYIHADWWTCALCREHANVFDSTNATDQTREQISKDFPHSGTCPITLARHIEELLEGEPE